MTIALNPFKVTGTEDDLRRTINDSMKRPGRTGLASLARELTSDFDRRRFGAVEDLVFSSAGDLTDGDLGELNASADARALAAFRSARGTLERQQAGLGVTLDPTAQASQNRRLSLAQVASRVDSRNRALDSERNRRRVVQDAAFGANNQLTDLALQGFGYASAAEGQRQADFNRQRAEDKARRSQRFGQAIGIATAFI